MQRAIYDRRTRWLQEQNFMAKCCNFPELFFYLRFRLFSLIDCAFYCPPGGF